MIIIEQVLEVIIMQYIQYKTIETFYDYDLCFMIYYVINMDNL